jgi:hypothetical protein
MEEISMKETTRDNGEGKEKRALRELKSQGG